ncbi:microsomal signal peptidase 25 kda subunit [Cyclospora cayetanensis]|uniref:Signal peptidase complex subunit 2 n=1 Tax=Cyclospora cayetanensis TaxID=88456 RepID=A0A1D3D3C0_9EIME|nr:microsomal signal peptidase 25 kda subunit [Cyclospora cayetanensis]
MASDHSQQDLSGEEEEKQEELQLPSRKCSNLYSEAELSKNLSEFITDTACQSSYFRSDQFFSNLRIGLSLGACAVGGFASIFLPYPESKSSLFLAICVFFALMLVLFLLDLLVMQGAASCVRDEDGRPVFIDIGIDTKEAAAVVALRREKQILSRSIPLGDCFDSEGYLLTDNVSAALQQLMAEFASGETDERKALIKKKK